jgi:uncharacterized membrane protein
MKNNNIKIVCLPGEILPLQVVENLRNVNNIKKQKKKTFSWYKTEIANIFGITECDKKKYQSVKYKTFYGGFIVGEGSINVSAKKSKNALFGILIDPEFSITQHVNGFGFLFAALSLFETGSIHYKSGTNATLVYRIDNRRSIQEKVIPFWDTYIVPYQSFEQNQRILFFKRICLFLEQKKHKELHFFTNQILPLWDKLRKQKGQINESFPDLEAAICFAVEKGRRGSSETLRDLI